MAGFKSAKQRAFLFASDKDKLQGKNPQEIRSQKSSPMSIPTAHPDKMTMPSKAFSLGTIGQAPKFHPPVSNNIKPTSNPNMHLPKLGQQTIPALPGLPKFAKTRKFFK